MSKDKVEADLKKITNFALISERDAALINRFKTARYRLGLTF